MRVQPSPATFGGLRATRDAHRLATAILRDRVTTLATVACAGCRRPIAIATDPARPASEYAGHAVCTTCAEAPRIAGELAWGLDRVEPPVEAYADEIDRWAREGLLGNAH